MYNPFLQCAAASSERMSALHDCFLWNLSICGVMDFLETHFTETGGTLAVSVSLVSWDYIFLFFYLFF